MTVPNGIASLLYLDLFDYQVGLGESREKVVKIEWQQETTKWDSCRNGKRERYFNSVKEIVDA